MARPGLLRGTLTLLAGGAVAQALPLLLGPWLTRLFAPAEFGLYHVFASVAATVAVVACARYEFALPKAGHREADVLRALCIWLLLAVSALSLLPTIPWALSARGAWPLWLPLAVLALGAVSLATLWATRAERFRSLAIGRVMQHGGGALLQVGAGLLHWGVHGLIAAALAAAALTVALLRLPLSGWREAPVARLREVAAKYRDFPLLNTPHAFASTLQDALALGMIAFTLGAAAAGFWGLALRYLKAPATLVGGALSQALYPRLASHGEGPTVEGRADLRRSMLALSAIAVPLVALLWALGPWAFELAFGEPWRPAGELARALALYVGVHFVASPLAVVTMAWNAQAWALKLALAGQAVFIVALGVGLALGGLRSAGWAVSIAMTGYFGFYFWRLAVWPVAPAAVAEARP